MRPFRRVATGSGSLICMIAAGALSCSSPVDPAAAHGIIALRVTPTSATLSAAPSVFTRDGAIDLVAELVDRNGEHPDLVPTWTSSDPTTAEVGPSGTVIGLKPGVVTITAAYGSKRGFATVRVTPPTDTGILIIAHRGFPRLFPENTIPAITGAFDVGADAVEFDVRLSKDSVPVLMHDATVDRTTDGTGEVNSLTLAQLQALNACWRFRRSVPPCPVPTLESALAAARGRGRLVIELKDPFPYSLVGRVLADLRHQGMVDQVLLTSFNYDMVKAIRALAPGIPVGYINSGLPGALRLYDIAALGRSAVMPRDSVLLADTGAARTLMRIAVANRMDVVTWTAQSSDQVKALVALGVRHIVSDIPIDKSTLSAPPTAARRAHPAHRPAE